MAVDEVRSVRSGRRVARWGALGGAVMVFEALWLRGQFGGEFATAVVADVLGILVTAPAAAACVGAARRVGDARRRHAWMLLGGAVASWGLGMVAWSYYELILRQEPFPSIADLGFLGTIPLAAAAVLMFASDASGGRAGSRGARTLLDGMIIAGSLLFVSWALVLGPLYRAGFASTLEGFLSISYPAGDVAVLAATVFLLARIRRGRAALILVALGLVALSVADSGFTYLVLKDAYATGNLIDVVWDIGFVLIGLGALAQERAVGSPEALHRADVAQEDDRRGTTTFNVLIPYVPAACAVGVAATEGLTRGGLGTFLTWNAIAVVGVVLIRQLITLLDNVALNRDLAAKVEARTADLQASVRELEAANALQESFVASVSHELRTPLTLIVGAASSLARPELALADPARGLAAITLHGAQRMSLLIEDLIVASGVADGRLGGRAPVSLDAVTASVLEGFASNDRRLVVQIPAGLMVQGDAGSLSVVLRQLLSNAEKFSQSGSRVFVEACDRGDWVDIIVADEGIGIVRSDREKIFDRFTQLDGTSTRRYGGLGLGLYLARCLTEAMGGTIAVVDDSRFVGTTFRVTLSQARSVTAPLPEASQPQETLTEAAS